MSRPQEVTLELDTNTVREWDMEVGDPHERPLPPVLLFLARDLPEALQGEVVWENGDGMTVTPDGFATTFLRDGGSYVYELFPARFNDDRPYEPLCYVGRWPD